MPIIATGVGMASPVRLMTTTSASVIAPSSTCESIRFVSKWSLQSLDESGLSEWKLAVIE